MKWCVCVSVFCVLRCCWRWQLKHSNITGSVLSMSALRPAAKDCLISPNFISRSVLPTHSRRCPLFIYLYASVQPGRVLQFLTICCVFLKSSTTNQQHNRNNLKTPFVRLAVSATNRISFYFLFCRLVNCNQVFLNINNKEKLYLASRSFWILYLSKSNNTTI